MKIVLDLLLVSILRQNIFTFNFKTCPIIILRKNLFHNKLIAELLLELLICQTRELSIIPIKV
eukprot:snap_masked-scaffold_10-processed-gene-7.4-mRNA-1 protein AED:1.00 eAED:1.00 QI:0/0/0/0/1/1/2/0/62